MDNKMMVLLEDIKLLVMANIKGQKAFEERFERRLTNLELDMAEIKKTILVIIKEIGNIKRELADVRNELADVKNDLKLLESKVTQLRETVTASNRKNEMWFDLMAREYGKLRFELEALKEEVNLLSQNVQIPAE